MSVSLVAKNEQCGEIDIANGTFFDMVNLEKMQGILLPVDSNDPISVTKVEALAMAAVIKEWHPPQNWFLAGNSDRGKEIMINFLNECGGFTTY